MPRRVKSDFSLLSSFWTTRKVSGNKDRKIRVLFVGINWYANALVAKDFFFNNNNFYLNQFVRNWCVMKMFGALLNKLIYCQRTRRRMLL